MVTVKFGGPRVMNNTTARNTRIQAIFKEYASNLRSPESLRVRLDAMQIRGGLAQTGYTGYDYAAQRWIEVTF